jgi:hypothetical protein
VERDVEGLVEARVGLEVVPVREPRHEDQVARRGDRQKLGQPLRDAEDEGLPVGEAAGRLANVRRRQDRRDEQEERSDPVDERRANAPPRLSG